MRGSASTSMCASAGGGGTATWSTSGSRGGIREEFLAAVPFFATFGIEPMSCTRSLSVRAAQDAHVYLQLAYTTTVVPRYAVGLVTGANATGSRAAYAKMNGLVGASAAQARLCCRLSLISTNSSCANAVCLAARSHDARRRCKSLQQSDAVPQPLRVTLVATSKTMQRIDLTQV